MCGQISSSRKELEDILLIVGCEPPGFEEMNLDCLDLNLDALNTAINLQFSKGKLVYSVKNKFHSWSYFLNGFLYMGISRWGNPFGFLWVRPIANLKFTCSSPEVLCTTMLWMLTLKIGLQWGVEIQLKLRVRNQLRLEFKVELKCKIWHFPEALLLLGALWMVSWSSIFEQPNINPR